MTNKELRYQVALVMKIDEEIEKMKKIYPISYEKNENLEDIIRMTLNAFEDDFVKDKIKVNNTFTEKMCDDIGRISSSEAQITTWYDLNEDVLCPEFKKMYRRYRLIDILS